MHRIVSSITSLDQHFRAVEETPSVYHPPSCPHCGSGVLRVCFGDTAAITARPTAVGLLARYATLCRSSATLLLPKVFAHLLAPAAVHCAAALV